MVILLSVNLPISVDGCGMTLMKFIISASNTIGRSALILQLRYALFKEEKPVGNNNIKCECLSLLDCFAVSLGK
jgi:hypothetical protein